MNKIYRVIWSYAKNAYVVVSELASRKKMKRSKGAIILGSILGLFLINGFTFAYTKTSLNGQLSYNTKFWTSRSDYAKAESLYSIALGLMSSVAGSSERAVALGESTKIGTNSYRAIAAGTRSEIGNDSNSAIAIGDAAIVKDNTAHGIAIGLFATVEGESALAMGRNSHALKEESIAIGKNSKVTEKWAQAFGVGSEVSSEAAIAIGYSTKVTAKNAVAIGAYSEADKENTVSFGSSKHGARKLTYVGKGDISEVSSDAINGSQLYAMGQSIATALGGDSAINKDGVITAPTYTVGGEEVNDIGEALTTINNNVTNVTEGKAGLIQLAGSGDSQKLIIGNILADKAMSFDLSNGKTGRKLTGLANGEVEKGSTDAITGDQLFATNEKVKANTASIGDLNTSLAGINVDNGVGGEKPAESLGEALTTINNNVTNVTEGKAGLIQLAGSGDSQRLIIGNTLADKAMSFDLSNGKTGRKLTGLANGEVKKGSTDAITGDQLFATNEKVKANTATIDDLNTSLAGINVDNGVGGEKPAESLGEALTTINNNVTNVTEGKAGLIQLAGSGDSQRLIIGNTLADKAMTFDLSNGKTGRKLTGLANGEVKKGSTDAITGDQLFATNEKVKANTATIDDLNTSLAGINVDNGVGGEKPAENLGEALTTINNNVTNVMEGKAGLIQLAGSGACQELIIGNTLADKAMTFNLSNGKTGRKLTGLANGEVKKGSTDAITGDQLFATNEKVKANTASIGDLNTSLASINVDNGVGGEKPAENLGEALTTINNNVTNVTEGKAGLIQLAGSGDSQKLIIGNTLADKAMTFDLSNGKTGRKLTGLANGEVKKGSTDAITGDQLFATNEKVKANTASIGDLNASLASINVDNGVGGEKPAANLGEALTTINNNVTNLTQNVAKVSGGISKFENGQLIGVDFSGAFRGASSGDITTVYAGFYNLDERVTELEKGQTGIFITKDKELFTNNEEETTKSNLVLATTSQKSSKKEKEISLNNDIVGSQDTINIGGADLTETNKTGDRTLTGVAKGDIIENSVDAINGSQLYASNESIAAIFGGGAKIDKDGYITTPEYVIGDKIFNNVGASIEYLANSITVSEVGVFQLDREKNQIIIADNNEINSETTLNVGDRKILGVANGKVEKGSQEVVNGGQLWETNQEVTSNTTQIKHINRTLDHYNNRISDLETTVHENRKRASAGTASAMAMSSIPYIDYAKYSMGMGTASYDGEAAMSIGMEFKLGDNGRFRVQGSYDTQNKAGVGVGIAFSF